MNIQPKTPYLEKQSETPAETQVGASQSPLEQTDSAEQNTAHSDSAADPETEQNTYERDQATTAASSAERHDQPANQMSFGEPSSVPQARSRSTSASRSFGGGNALQELQSLFKDKRAATDPAVLKLLDYIREMEDKNIQHMLDMMQQSLDRAHEMMKQNEKIYYTETLPKLEGIQELVAQEQANEVAVQEQQQTQVSTKVDQAQHRSDRTVAHKLQHLTREIQQTADVEVPPNHAQLLTELQQALQLALVL